MDGNTTTSKAMIAIGHEAVFPLLSPASAPFPGAVFFLDRSGKTVVDVLVLIGDEHSFELFSPVVLPLLSQHPYLHGVWEQYIHIKATKKMGLLAANGSKEMEHILL